MCHMLVLFNDQNSVYRPPSRNVGVFYLCAPKSRREGTYTRLGGSQRLPSLHGAREPIFAVRCLLEPTLLSHGTQNMQTQSIFL